MGGDALLPGTDSAGPLRLDTRNCSATASRSTLRRGQINCCNHPGTSLVNLGQPGTVLQRPHVICHKGNYQWVRDGMGEPGRLGREGSIS